MDETAVANLITSLLAGTGPSGMLVVAVLYAVSRWWRDVSAHLCNAVPQALAIAEKIADDGIQVNLNLNLIESSQDEKQEDD